jgi:trigger factor
VVPEVAGSNPVGHPNIGFLRVAGSEVLYPSAAHDEPINDKRRAMQSDVIEAGPFERMLTLHLDDQELEQAKDAAARKLSRDLKIKGFRPGKAPRAVVERMVGADRLRGEAIDEALPEMVGKAIAEAELEPVTTPRVETVEDRDDGGVTVEVRLTLWPTLSEVPDIDGREVVVDVPAVGDDEIEEQIDRFRAQFAELEEVDRAGDEGDFMLVNITALDGGAEIEEASASDLMYEIGSRSFIPGLDELLVGASAGEIREGPATLPAGFGDLAGQEVSLRVLVKGVRGKRLPEVTDEWVEDVSEFESVAELRETLERNLSMMKLSTAIGSFQDTLVDGLIADMHLELPEALVQAEMEASLHNLYHSLESQGLDLANYLRITGQGEEQFAAELRERAERALNTRILLEGIGREQGVEVTDEEIAEATESLAGSAGRSVDEVRSALQSSGQEQALTGDILRRKVLDLLIGRARAVDAQGNEVDLSPPPVDDVDGSPEEPDTPETTEEE